MPIYLKSATKCPIGRRILRPRGGEHFRSPTTSSARDLNNYNAQKAFVLAGDVRHPAWLCGIVLPAGAGMESKLALSSLLAPDSRMVPSPWLERKGAMDGR